MTADQQAARIAPELADVPVHVRDCIARVFVLGRPAVRGCKSVSGGDEDGWQGGDRWRHEVQPGEAAPNPCASVEEDQHRKGGRMDARPRWNVDLQLLAGLRAIVESRNGAMSTT